MTAIAYANGVLACDSQLTTSGIRVENDVKFRIRKDGAVVTGTGPESECDRAIEKIMACTSAAEMLKIELPERSDAEIFIAYRDGRTQTLTAGGWTLKKRVHTYAAGNAYSFLYGALAVDPDAAKAVLAAAHSINNCGFPVYAVEIATGKVRRYSERSQLARSLTPKRNINRQGFGPGFTGMESADD